MKCGRQTHRDARLSHLPRWSRGAFHRLQFREKGNESPLVDGYEQTASSQQRPQRAQKCNWSDFTYWPTRDEKLVKIGWLKGERKYSEWQNDFMKHNPSLLTDKHVEGVKYMNSVLRLLTSDPRSKLRKKQISLVNHRQALTFVIFFQYRACTSPSHWHSGGSILQHAAAGTAET